jgi:hypothetical protein
VKAGQWREDAPTCKGARSGLRAGVIATLALALAVISNIAHAACVDVKQTGSLTFEATLTFHIFGGPSYYGGVRLGDTQEPSYIVVREQQLAH